MTDSPAHRASQIKRDRRALIALLAMVYPGSMAGEELFRLIVDENPEYSRRFMTKDLYYLHEKGYLSFLGRGGVAVQRMTIAECAFRLTAAGTDVANEIARDPALEI